MTCRFCNQPLVESFIDLGMSPLCESMISAEELNREEIFYPLHAYVCSICFLVQLDEFVSPKDIFEEYAYFSSYSDSWLQHSSEYAERMEAVLGLGSESRVIEVASNDGYLLQYFASHGIPVLGIEPARNVASVALEKGIDTRVDFFNKDFATELVEQRITADLLIGNNVLAQVPDLNSFVAGLKLVLNPKGILTLEFPHLLRLIEGNQFDTIYHEHFSYFSLITCDKIFSKHGLRIYDVDEIQTHGGSLRLYLRHEGDSSKPVSRRVGGLLDVERSAGFEDISTYSGFEKRVHATKRRLLTFLISAKEDGKSVAGYGAPGKGNTLLNYCGIRQEFLSYTVDRNPYKQGKFLPGTHIPVYSPEKISETEPDYVLILPWNLKDEITEQLEFIKAWGGKVVVPIPELEIVG